MNAYKNIENNVDKTKEYEGLIKGLIEDTDQSKFTEEQNFLINYYDLDREKCRSVKFDMNNIIDNINEMKAVPGVSSEKLEENRHEALLDLFFATENFSREKANKNRDRVHKIINDWNEYSKEFEKNPLIVKQMINLQALNRMAHQYKALFKGILYSKYSQLDI